MGLPTFDALFKQIKFNFWLMGIPYDDSGFKLQYPVFLLWLWLMFLAEALFLISKISKVNFLEITQLAPCTCIGLLSFLKIIAITMKRKNIYRLTENLQKLYLEIENNEEDSALVLPGLVLLQLLIKYFFILNLVLISVYNFSSPIIMICYYFLYGDVEYILPYAVLLPFEVDSWLSWIIVYFPSIMSGLICVLYFTTTDVLYCLLTTLICAKFTVISNKFQKMNVANSAVLQTIVREHQYILKLSKDLEDIFTAPNLFNMLVGSLEICALGFNLTSGELKNIPGCILFLVSVLLQILMMSVFGENIITESKKIGQAAYTSKWYEMDEKSKKIILLILTRNCYRTLGYVRSAKPTTLTAYKFSVISYVSFGKILSTSWSYFTILRTVYTPPSSSNQE